MRRLPTLLLLLLAGPLPAEDWPQWLGPKRDAVWRESGILKRFPKLGLKVVWRSPIGPGYTGPAVAGGDVITLDRTVAGDAEIPDNPFKRGSISGTERIRCYDEATGGLRWQHEYDCAYTISYPKGPRATPIIDGRHVYTLGAEGDLFCLNRANGKVVWHHRLGAEFGAKTPTWGFAAHPLLDGDRLICTVGGPGSAVVAFDRHTGKEIWRAGTTKDIGYAPPVIYRAGGRRQLIVWLIDAIHSLDPVTGETFWKHPWKVRGGGNIAMPRQYGDKLFLSTFFNGSLMLQLDPTQPAVTTLWQSPKITTKDTTHLHALNTVPLLADGHIYGVCNYGQFRCLRIADGERRWESLAPLALKRPHRNATAFIVKHEDRCFIVTDGGELVIARLQPDGYTELDRTRLIEPTDRDGNRPVVWAHPAFANRRIYARNDREILCASLAAASEPD